jgi:hypothetical protein
MWTVAEALEATRPLASQTVQLRAAFRGVPTFAPLRSDLCQLIHIEDGNPPTRNRKAHTMTPSHHIFAVRERSEGKKSVWTRIGVLWPHTNGDGFNIEIEALPLNFTGKLVAMVNTDSDAG